MSICAGFMFFTAIIALTLRTFLVWKNQKLNQKFGHEVEDATATGVEDYGPNFRYVL
jgi:hypothetical protein